MSNSDFEKRLRKHQSALRAIDGKKVEAGWFESARYKAGTRPNGKAIPASQVGMSIALIARINERGTATIPARPFMRYAEVLFSRDRIEIQAKIGKKVIEGKISPDQALGQIGNALEAKIVESIKTGPWPRNADSTFESKGFDSPLRDTGQMFQTVTSKVS